MVCFLQNKPNRRYREMKKVLVLITAVIGAVLLAACGGGSGKTQTIVFQGITMEIPANWKLEESTADEDYAIYEKSGSKSHEYKLLLTNTFGLMDDGSYDLERAGEFFKEVTDDDASFSDPSDPVAGTFAGKYDMHTIECHYNMHSVTQGEISFPCKRIRIYMGDHDVVMQFSTAEGDFEAFDAAVAGATCE